MTHRVNSVHVLLGNCVLKFIKKGTEFLIELPFQKYSNIFIDVLRNI